MGADEIRAFYDELSNLPDDLQKSITSKFAKLTGLKMFTGENAFQRDSQRLDAKQRAYYRKMGLELTEDDDVAITNVLADNITLAGNEPKIIQPEIQKPPPPQPIPETKPRMPAWAGAMLGAALVGTPLAGLTGYLLARPDKTVTAIDSQERTTIGLSVED